MWPLKTAASSANKATYSGEGPLGQIRAGKGLKQMLLAPIEAFYGFLYEYGLPLLFFGALVLFFWVLWTVDFTSI